MSVEFDERTLQGAVNRHNRRLFTHRGVTAVGTGYRWRGGEVTSELCVSVFVTKKRPPGYIPKSEIIPRSLPIQGRTIGVDVIEGGPFYADPVILSELEPVFEGVPSPELHGGCEISLEGTNSEGKYGAGTLGAIVQDKRDGSYAVLSNNHVLLHGRGKAGDKILQPARTAESMEIAELTRWVDYPPGHLHLPEPDDIIRSDAAIATLLPEANWEPGFMVDPSHGPMAPVSSDHPAVGLHFAGDSLGLLACICQIELVLDDLDAELPSPDSTRHVTVGDLLEPIEKVGRTTGYTSSKVYWHNIMLPIFLRSGADEFYPVWVSNIIVSYRLGRSGDSGSLVCFGGDGNTLAPAEAVFPICEMLARVGSMYDLPLTDDQEMADRVRDEFLLRSVTGGLLVQCFYTNQYAMLERTEGVVAPPTDQSYADMLYGTYRDYIVGALDDPDDPVYRVNETHLADLDLICSGVAKYLTQEEHEAMYTIVDEVVHPTLGMGVAELIAYLNDPQVFHRVLELLEAVPTIEIPGPLEPGNADNGY